MFSCCRCVNPKSPKYKKKGAKDDEDDDSSVVQDAPCQDKNHGESSEEEIKVEIIETEDSKESTASPPPAASDGTGTGSGTSTSTATASPAKAVPTENEANQSQQQPVAVDSPKDSPAKAATPQAEETVDEPAPENVVIPATVAEVEQANEDDTTAAKVADVTPVEESVITASDDLPEEQEEVAEESESCELKNEENNVIMEHAVVEDATNECPEEKEEEPSSGNSNDGDKKQEPEQEQKVRECDGNDESQSSDSGPPSEIEILPGTGTMAATSAQNEPEAQSDKVGQENEEEDDDDDGGNEEDENGGQRSERTLRLRSDTSNSQATIEETIDIQNYLPKQGESEEDASPNGLMDTGDSGNNELCSDDNHVPKTAPDKSDSPEQQPASRNGSVSEEPTSVRSSRPSVTESIENGHLPTSRKESANSDDTTIRTQLSFRESCLSRRSSSKSSIKKKVAYNDSTEIIPPPEYSPAVNDEEDEVFSDSIAPKLPRGNMCAPYATKRGSIPGLVALPDWFAEDRLMMLVFVGFYQILA